jgi:dimethylamine monooxygenase subunit A
MVASFVYPPPNDGKPFRLNMGLRSLEPAQWLESGDDLTPQIIERQELIESAREVVYQELPGYKAAIKELVDRIVVNLKEFHDRDYTFTSNTITYLPTDTTISLNADDVLLQLASIIAEDLVVLAREDSEWKIVAGAVIFPSRWKLSEKIGKGMDAVHTPVPGYATALAPYMTATFDKITVERPVWRKNWSLHSTEHLHQPTSIHEPAAPENYWWRTERQTLTRAQEGEFIYFTIRNRAEPLHWIKGDPTSSALFAETLASYSPETIAYKGLVKDHQAIVDYLRA